MTDAVHYSSKKSDWQTPPDLFIFLDKIFEFDTDACADKNNSLCPVHYSKDNSFLDAHITYRSIFMNPIYGKPMLPCKTGCEKDQCIKYGHTTKYIPGIGDFVDHAYQLSKHNNKIVALLPARIGSKWFETVWHADCLIFMRGRIKFVGAKSGAPFPSVVAVFGYGVSLIEKQNLSKIGEVICPR